jgi:hypothetical protein
LPGKNRWRKNVKESLWRRGLWVETQGVVSDTKEWDEENGNCKVLRPEWSRGWKRGPWWDRTPQPGLFGGERLRNLRFGS